VNLEELRRIIRAAIPDADVRIGQSKDILRVYRGRWAGAVSHFPKDGDKYRVTIVDLTKEGEIPCVTAKPDVDELHESEQSAGVRLAQLLRERL
jgi:hypothetical protein